MKMDRGAMQVMLILLPAGLALFVCLYHLLPAWLRSLDPRLAQAALDNQPGRTAAFQPGWLSALQARRFAARIRLFLQKAGYHHPLALELYLLAQLGIPVFLLAYGLLTHPSPWIPVASAAGLAAWVNNTVQIRVRKRQQAFSRSLYKVYRFLESQILSGVAVTDALRGLPEAVRDRVVQPVLIRFTAIFEVTCDMEQAFTVIRQSFSGQDVDLLQANIRQCLQTGVAGKSMQRMEDLLFARFFSQMQVETNRVRHRLVWTAAAGLVPVAVLFLYPLVQGALSALDMIFG
ncbi:MAG: hypothetical protein GX112_10615 [Clostridiaceae bacterium]|jgi:Flp pilus assembly protein TadB|nr:hypothetical protein [Clostridiaceae bacterium]